VAGVNNQPNSLLEYGSNLGVRRRRIGETLPGIGVKTPFDLP